MSILDLLTLPDSERRILAHVARHDPITLGRIAAATGYDLPDVVAAVDLLVAQGRLQCWPDGVVTAQLGRVRPRATLAGSLEPLAGSWRVYSEQEIATLRAAIPMLQFARARLTVFNDHGPNHARRVASVAGQLGCALGLTELEHHLLRAGAFFHDIGNVVDRTRHHVISQETVEKLAAIGRLPFTAKEAHVVGLLCRWHRKEYDPTRTDIVRSMAVRTGLLASILRIADAMDLDYRRADYDARFLEIIRFFFPEEMPFWTAINALGLRLRCRTDLAIQVFKPSAVADDKLVDELRRDIAGTPMNWPVQVIPAGVERHSGMQSGLQVIPGSAALLVFSFDAHSLVMAALSRRQLMAAGCTVECLCFPDNAHAAAWLWGAVLGEIDVASFARLVVIGDRTDASTAPLRLDLLRRWRSAGKEVTLLNRHEHTWTDLPDLRSLGVDLILGGDWAYFWGDQPTAADLTWGRIAALCTRDATMSPGVTDVDLAVCQGLLHAVFNALAGPEGTPGGAPADTTAGWLALAEPILAAVAADAFDDFRQGAGKFIAHYCETALPASLHGNVLYFAGPLSPLEPAAYWVLETAIERHGRRRERGIHFAAPYAIAVWPAADAGASDAVGRAGDTVELLAITHWQEERALPIRLLFPAGLGLEPHGNEHSIYMRLGAAQAAEVVAALIAACNRVEE